MAVTITLSPVFPVADLPSDRFVASFLNGKLVEVGAALEIPYLDQSLKFTVVEVCGSASCLVSFKTVEVKLLVWWSNFGQLMIPTSFNCQLDLPPVEQIGEAFVGQNPLIEGIASYCKLRSMMSNCFALCSSSGSGKETLVRLLFPSILVVDFALPPAPRDLCRQLNIILQDRKRIFIAVKNENLLSELKSETPFEDVCNLNECRRYLQSLIDHYPPTILVSLLEEPCAPAFIRGGIFFLNWHTAEQATALLCFFNFPYIGILNAMSQYMKGYFPAEIKSAIEFLEKHYKGKEDGVKRFLLENCIPSRLAEKSNLAIRRVALSSVIGLDLQHRQLIHAIRSHFSAPTVSNSLTRGAVLWGESGCGKSLLVSALSTHLQEDLGIGVVVANASSLRSRYVGDSEKAVSRLFQDARSHFQSLVVVEDLQMLFSKRSAINDNRLINCLLMELDGIQRELERNRVFFIGTTSDLSLIDGALLRPGRLSLHVNIPIMSEEGRLLFWGNKMQESAIIADSSEISALVKATKGYSGAMLEGLLQKAALVSIGLGDCFIPACRILQFID